MKTSTIIREMSICKAAFIALFALALSPGPVAAQSPPTVGGLLPEMNLTIPTEPKHRNYLGLKGEGVFKISQIQAEVVIIEIYSMYCPYCQREAPLVNELYESIEKNPKSKGRVKLIGIGVGNSAFEVNVFRKKYNVQFPLFNDADFTIHKNLGEVRTPYFIGVRIEEGGSHKVFFSKLGGLKNADDFLQQMLKLSGH